MGSALCSSSGVAAAAVLDEHPHQPACFIRLTILQEGKSIGLKRPVEQNNSMLLYVQPSRPPFLAAPRRIVPTALTRTGPWWVGEKRSCQGH
eukprot:208169-Amphidinium_carterae.1